MLIYAVPGAIMMTYYGYCGREGPKVVDSIGEIPLTTKKHITGSRWCSAECAQRGFGKNEQSPAEPRSLFYLSSLLLYPI